MISMKTRKQAANVDRGIEFLTLELWTFTVNTGILFGQQIRLFLANRRRHPADPLELLQMGNVNADGPME